MKASLRGWGIVVVVLGTGLATPLQGGAGSPDAGAAPAPHTMEDYRDRQGETFTFRLTGDTTGPVWGTDIYSDDSVLAAAAVHAGVLRPGETGTVAVRVLPGRDRYVGSTRHDVTSVDWEQWYGSYAFVVAPVPERPAMEDATPASVRAAERPVPRAGRPTGMLATPPPSMVASEVIQAAGGVIVVRKPDDPLDGLELRVPAGAYDEARAFKILSAPITRHTFGEHFHPLTPLITVENGEGYAHDFMTVRVPITLPDGYFAMPFYYDEASGRLEGIPFKSLERGAITVVTRRFSSFTISGILNANLDALIERGIDSGFRPGVDDWQFPNHGSYISPDGHCTGQSLSALWYYCTQPDGEHSFLWGLYDNNRRDPATPQRWTDDSYGYRLASTVQEDVDWRSFQNLFLKHLAGVSDELAFKAFAYGMHMTGEPQEVGLFTRAGKGHDMIVFRVDRHGLAIADPNYPGNRDLRIRYANGTFAPYTSGASATEIAAGNVDVFDTIQYCAKATTIDWRRIEARWQEFRAGTIGNDRFPSYQIEVVHEDGTREPLVDGYESEHERILIGTSSPPASMGYRVYREQQPLIPGPDGKYGLEEGYNLFGVEIWGDVNNDPNDRRWRYVDFQYLNVWYGPEDAIAIAAPAYTYVSEHGNIEISYTLSGADMHAFEEATQSRRRHPGQSTGADTLTISGTVIIQGYALRNESYRRHLKDAQIRVWARNTPGDVNEDSQVFSFPAEQDVRQDFRVSVPMPEMGWNRGAAYSISVARGRADLHSSHGEAPSEHGGIYGRIEAARQRSGIGTGQD